MIHAPLKAKSSFVASPDILLAYPDGLFIGFSPVFWLSHPHTPYSIPCEVSGMTKNQRGQSKGSGSAYF